MSDVDMNGASLEDLLRMQIAVMGRIVFPEEKLLALVTGGNAKANKQLRAYNMCDGTRIQSQIAAECKIDPGSFNRTLSRWSAAGIVYRVRVGDRTVLQHIYPVTSTARSKEEE